MRAASALRWPPADPPAMKTCRGSAAVLVCVLVHPCDRSLGVDQRIGERRVRAQPVVGLDAEPASAREVVHDRQALLILPAVRPRATVEVDQHRTVLRARSVNVEVELVPDAAVSVREVGEVLRRRAGAPGTEPKALVRRRRPVVDRVGASSGSTSCSKFAPSPWPSARSIAGPAARQRRTKIEVTEHRRPDEHDRGDAERRIERAEHDEQNEQHRVHDQGGARHLAGNEPDHPSEPAQHERTSWREHRQARRQRAQRRPTRRRRWSRHPALLEVLA